MNLDLNTLSNTLINRGLKEDPNFQSASGAFYLIQQASRAVFSIFTPLASLKFCPRKKKSVCFSKDVTLNVFSQKSAVIANKTEHALRMSLEHDFLRPVQVHYHLERLGYEVEESSTSCMLSPAKEFETMIQKCYPFSEGLTVYSKFIDTIINNPESSEHELVLALKAYIYTSIWSQVCKPKIHQSSQRFAEWAMDEFAQRFLETMNANCSKQMHLDAIKQAIRQRNVTHYDSYSLKEFISCHSRRPMDLKRDIHYRQNVRDVKTKCWQPTEVRNILLRPWGSDHMDVFYKLIDSLINDPQFEEILSKLYNR